jgi:predicted DsbA family dithiol-disulfide isomerase
VGKRSIELAAQSNNVDLELVWKPFMLNPNGPVAGEDKMQAYMRKFGAQARSFLTDPNNMIAKRGREMGLDYQYHDGSKTFNTIHPHRLMYYTLEKYGVEAQNKLQEVLFRRYFKEGQNLGPIAEDGDLVAGAVESGLDKAEVLTFLKSEEAHEEVQEEMVESHSKVSGVPHFYFPESGLETSGGQTQQAFQKLLSAEAQALDRKKKA